MDCAASSSRTAPRSRAGTPRGRGRTHPRVSGGRDRRRPAARDGELAARLLRSARASPADARCRAARDPRRLVRSRPGAASRRMRQRLGGRERGARRARAPGEARRGARAPAGSARVRDGEIERVDPDPGERALLAAERDRLRNLEGLRAAAWTTQQALADEDAGALRALASVESSLEAATALDGGLPSSPHGRARWGWKQRICSARSPATAIASRPSRDAWR